ncbi:hypothetical protein B5M42_002190 [Paenibacillus athensensis]|uniref:Integrase catalytic domain-containing protein n=1 Tax=Paenibacillus athensensis TaxID=1967502 RepID=A0A4Y8QB47_9BACL|nr:hypothetical protein [Paenibacillus athensensis]MCD1257648.1 hypothetical protein [Paenibacillus athensensis]
MAMKRLLEDLRIDEQNLNPEYWPTVNKTLLSNENLEIYEKREKAILMYLRGHKNSEIYEQTQISAKELRRFIRRCFEVDGATGLIWGFRAIIPKKRISEYYRKASTTRAPGASTTTKGLNGAFSKLLDTNPHIKEQIDKAFLQRRIIIDEIPIVKGNLIHRHFVDLCKKSGIGLQDYPFNTKDMGKRSLYRYLKSLKNIHFSAAAKSYGKEAARRSKLMHDNVDLQSPMIVRPYQRVQFDGHRIDALFSITFTTLEGDTITEILDRVWLLIIIDEATRAVLGKHLSLNKEYTADDVLLCIKDAVVPHTKRELTISGLTYLESGGFPSSVIPEAEWGLWDELSFDNGKSNLSKMVKDRLHHIVECRVNPGPVGFPEKRGIIERFFRTLEDRGYHKTITTTGSNPSDPLRNNPEKQAKKFNISIDELEEITEVLISDYNGIPHGGINNFTPLELMRQRIARGMEPRVMEPDKRKEASFLTIQTTRTVQGSITKGKRPLIHFFGVDYRSEVLSRSPNLIGSQLTLVVNVEDLRAIRVFLKDGSDLGYLTAAGHWGISPHTLRERKAILRAKEKREIFFTKYDDPMSVFRQHIKAKAKTNKSARSLLAQLNRRLDHWEQKEPASTQLPGDLQREPKKHSSPLTESEEIKTKRIFKTIFH